MKKSSIVEKFNKYTMKDDRTDCLLWIGAKSSRGYGYLRLGKDTRRAHRVSYELFKGKIPNGMLVCHSCDNPICVNPKHLWLGTSKDNSHDRNKKGRAFKTIGETNGMSKLTKNNVIEIKSLLGKCQLKKLLKKFNISNSHVYSIKNNHCWSESLGVGQ